MIYFDNAATTLKKPQSVYKAVYETMIKYGANAGRGGHKLSVKASELINETRLLLSDFFGIENPERLAFFSNATFAINTAIKGYLSYGDHVVTTSMEHNSVIRPLAELKRQGKIDYTAVLANEKGEISVEDIEKAIRYQTKMVIMTHCSNVCGNIYDINKVKRICEEKGIILMVDAAQSAGILKLNSDMADIIAFSGHKGLLGPQGTGGLYIKEGINIKSLTEGGTGSLSESLYHPDIIPDKFECGTQNTPAICALGAGVRFVREVGTDNILKHEQSLSKYFTDELKNINNIIIYGSDDYRKRTGVVSINMESSDCNLLADELSSKYNIAVRSGLHCAPLAHKTLNTINTGTVRFSFGLFNTKQEIDKAINALYTISKNDS